MACLGFFAIFVEKHVELGKELNTEFGTEEGKKKTIPDEAGPAHFEEKAISSPNTDGERGSRCHGIANVSQDPIKVQEDTPI